MNITKIIGSYEAFFADLLYRLKEINIQIDPQPLSQLLYRVETLSKYQTLLAQLKPFCKKFVETQFNGRAVSILLLKKPLILAEDFNVSVIELPAPRAVHRYLSGLESIGIVIGKTLPKFIEKYRHIITGVKDHGTHCQPAFVTFDNEKTVKFYDISLLEIIKLQGWQLELL